MSADAGYDFLLVPGAGLPELTVLDFRGREALSAPYDFRLRVHSPSPLDAAALCGAPARFRFAGREGRGQVRHGALAALEPAERTPWGWAQTVRLVPRLWMLGLERRNRVFVGRSLHQILVECLEAGGLADHLALGPGCGGEPGSELERPRPFILQTGESTLDFLSRHLERAGLTYRFIQEAKGERLQLLDGAWPEEPAPRLPWVKGPGLEGPEGIHAFGADLSLLPGCVELQGCDLRGPSQGWKGGMALEEGEPGLWQCCGEDGEGPSDLERRAAFLAQAMRCRARRFQGSGDAPELAPGAPFILEGHENPRRDGAYRVLEATHWGGQPLDARGRRQAPRYGNTFQALPMEQPFRPEWQHPRPRLGGVHLAHIEAPGKHPQLDPGQGGGRYRVRLPFDQGERPGEPSSAWVPLLQPTGGRRQGMHFPLRAGVPVLLGFVEGDPDRPAIVGVLTDAEHPSPVQAEQPLRAALRSEAGHALLSEPSVEGSVLRLESPWDVQLSAEGLGRLDAAGGLLLRSGSDSITLTSSHQVTLHCSGALSAALGDRWEGVAGLATHVQLGNRSEVLAGTGTKLHLGRFLKVNGGETRLTLGPRLDLRLGRPAPSYVNSESAVYRSWRQVAKGWSVRVDHRESPAWLGALCDSLEDAMRASIPFSESLLALGALTVATVQAAGGWDAGGPAIAAGSLGALEAATHLWNGCRARPVPEGPNYRYTFDTGIDVHCREGQPTVALTNLFGSMGTLTPLGLTYETDFKPSCERCDPLYFMTRHLLRCRYQLDPDGIHVSSCLETCPTKLFRTGRVEVLHNHISLSGAEEVPPGWGIPPSASLELGLAKGEPHVRYECNGNEIVQTPAGLQVRLRAKNLIGVNNKLIRVYDVNMQLN